MFVSLLAMSQRLLILCALVLAVNSAIIPPKQLEIRARGLSNTDWWGRALFYSIFARSFQDSDGDGIGDIQGVIERLDYLKDLEVTGIWLSPILKSPQIDQGYDISDYLDIDSDFGTLADFKELIQKAKELGIKIILDLVPNHTSDQHEWFKKSVAKEEGYENFYIWHDGIVVDGIRQPPNNWISNFKGSAWEWNEERQQYYYHNFALQEPDLNYSNPLVIEAMKDVLRYWLAFGVDGFKLDALPYLFEDPEFRDEPLASGYSEYDVNDFNSIDHIYTKDLQENFDIIYQFRAVIDEYNNATEEDTKILVAEADSHFEVITLYYGDKEVPGAHFVLNFNFISNLSPNFTRDDIFDNIYPWIMNLRNEYTSNWMLGNDANHRLATRLGKQYIDAFNMLSAMLPGVMVTYYGEEIGMEDGEVTCEQGYDPKAIKDCTTFAEISRDFERTPFHWDDSANAGFTTGIPWLPVSTKAGEVNLAAENVSALSSHYNIYKYLTNFRKYMLEFAWMNGVGVAKLSKNLLQINRNIDEKVYSLVFNVGNIEDLTDFSIYGYSYTILFSSDVNSLYTAGDSIDELILQPYETIIMLRNQLF